MTNVWIKISRSAKTRTVSGRTKTSLREERDPESNETEDIESENVPIYELVNSGDVIAVKAIDEDYYLLRVISPIYTLQCFETDDFRTSYDAGTKVIKGYYYCKKHNSVLNYKIDKKSQSSSTGVFGCVHLF